MGGEIIILRKISRKALSPLNLDMLEMPKA